jgi:hypothetical protein
MINPDNLYESWCGGTTFLVTKNNLYRSHWKRKHMDIAGTYNLCSRYRVRKTLICGRTSRNKDVVSFWNTKLDDKDKLRKCLRILLNKDEITNATMVYAPSLPYKGKTVKEILVKYNSRRSMNRATWAAAEALHVMRGQAKGILSDWVRGKPMKRLSYAKAALAIGVYAISGD